MSSRLVIKDAMWQFIGRISSALFGYGIIKLMTLYLGPGRYGDYSTILKYFAIWTALADLGVYVLALKRLGELKEKNDPKLAEEFGKYTASRLVLMTIVYTVAILVAYLSPSYTQNPYIARGLPFGMIFSASFMFAGIQQLPLQIFWKMERVTISLITARIVQVIILLPVLYFFAGLSFDGKPTRLTILAFCLILFSVVGSSIGQNIQNYIQSKKYIKLRLIFDRSFIRNLTKSNRKFGVSYYLSSFHTLFVLLILGQMFPTAQGHDYAGIRALPLSLVEMLLIIPSALGNSLLHKIRSYSHTQKASSMGNLLTLVFWIGSVMAINFRAFSPWIIRFVSDAEFLGHAITRKSWGSDQILPFLGIVLALSFVKQVYNYLFVSLEKQNLLLKINLVGVLIGACVGIPLIYHYGLLGGVITQVGMEALFVIGAVYTGRVNKANPIIPMTVTARLMAVPLVSLVLVGLLRGMVTSRTIFFVSGLVLNAIFVLSSRSSLKILARGLTIQDAVPIDEPIAPTI